MEGILVLKLHINAISHDIEPPLESLIVRIRDSLVREGYPDVRIQVEDAHISKDTLFVKLHLYNLHPFIPQEIELHGYLFSYPIFRSIARRFSKRKTGPSTIEDRLRSIDPFTGTKSQVNRNGNRLEITNTEPLRISGIIGIGDSITGSMEIDRELSSIFISRRRLVVQLGAGLPSPMPLAIFLRYYREFSTFYELFLGGLFWKAGISLDAESRRAGPLMSINVPGFDGFAKYIRGWKTGFTLDTMGLFIRLFHSSIDSTFAGGMTDIIGLPENSLKTNDYLITGLELPIYKNISITGQTYWINRGRMQIAAGIKIFTDHLEIMLAKGRDAPPILHLKIRN